MVPTTPFIAPSVLPADFGRLADEVVSLEHAGADAIHWDVMDGCFVPNLTFGPDVIAATRAHVSLPFEAHLMVVNPDPLLPRWVDAGCELICVHAEACPHLHRTLGAIADLGAQTGVALNPATPVEAVAHVLDMVDLVLVMSVNPGFGGQRYLPTMEAKISQLRTLIDGAGHEVRLVVDGGINADTIDGAFRAGADAFVAGSAVFGHEHGAAAAIQALRSACGASQMERVGA